MWGLFPLLRLWGPERKTWISWWHKALVTYSWTRITLGNSYKVCSMKNALWNAHKRLITTLTWASRSFFSDRSLRERTWGSEDKDSKKVLDQEVLCKLCLIPIEFIRKDNIFYTVCKVGDGTESAQSRHTMGWSQREANQAMLHKGNTVYLNFITIWAHSGLGTGNYNIFRGKSQVSRN